MSKNPTIVLVQGAFQTLEFYQTFKNRLEAAGFDVVHPVLPTCSGTDATDFREKGPSDDMKAIRSQVQELVEDSSENVVLAIHSYGGIVVGNIDFHDLSISHRRSKGLSGGVAHFIYFGSFMVPEGFSSLKVNGGDYPVDVELKPEGRYVYKNLAEKQFDELTEAEQKLWMSKTIPHTQKVFDFETSHAAWRYIPTTCLVLDKDKAVPAGIQEAMAAAAGAKIEHLDAGHGVVLGQPDLLTQKVTSVIKGLSL